MTADSTDIKRSSASSGSRLGPTILTLAIVFLAVVGLVAAGLWLRYDDTLRDGRRNAENLATVLSADLQIRVSDIEESLREIAAFSRFIGGPSAAGQEWMTLLRTVAAGRRGFEAFLITDAAGRTTFSSLPILMGESRADGEAFEVLSENPKNDSLVADAPERSSNDSKLVVPLARVIRTPSAEFEGMAIANFAPEQLREFYREVDVGENGVVWLLKPPDTVLLREPPSDRPNDEPPPAALASDIAPGQAGVANGPIESGGPQYVTAYRSLAGTGLTVAVSLATGDILAGWWNEVYAAVVLAVLVGLFLLVAAIALARANRASTSVSEE
jgi:hypothetical protein